MIMSFHDCETLLIFNKERSRRLPQEMQQTAFRKLRMIGNAATLEDLKVPPNNHLEKLKDDRAGQHSIRINGQWRICFKWLDGHAHDVEIVDYH
jgi:proteic killer suppression protein